MSLIATCLTLPALSSRTRNTERAIAIRKSGHSDLPASFGSSGELATLFVDFDAVLVSLFS